MDAAADHRHFLSRTAEERLRVAVEAADLGMWDWDIGNDRVAWSDAVYRLHGLAPGAFGGSVADFARLIHDDDRERVRTLIERSLAEDVPYAVEFRVDKGLALVDAFRPDVAILDIGLPKIDGISLAEKIRAATAGRCRLIAVTGYGLAEDRTRTKAAGFEAHFVKPVDLDVLVDALRAR
jgi:CheY-like chemotaxis protein